MRNDGVLWVLLVLRVTTPGLHRFLTVRLQTPNETRRREEGARWRPQTAGWQASQ